MHKSISSINFLILWTWLLTLIVTLIIYPNLNILSMLIFLTLFSVSIALNLSTFSSWSLLAYLTFLMMTGGIMILFTFFISLVSNLLVMKKWLMTTYFSVFIFILCYLNWNNLFSNSFMLNLNMNQEFFSLPFNQNLNNSFNLNSLYNYPNNFITISLIFYLLFSLIFITKISILNFKTLRMKNNYE